ncbi:acetate kinase [Marinobacter nanhaiticus D15-8W]|uniref:Acetate kinase n=1 Tax=Marinobacter nanhaiticus D15-8W TaxID=626887 RepID=N6VUJ7_9GAMM|nr:acetate kinase [Marinobacter nanhaiticus]ENO13810.1 acetate kinase [Marinobacter nanhaiticus D15-8W]BES71183.1 acetate kinase [Marinobacter nanhaiticus D15-8W]
MSDTLLVVNCGSSSLKLAVFSRDMQRQAQILAERLGTSDSSASIERKGQRQTLQLPDNSDHQQALTAVIEHLEQEAILEGAPLVIGHRVVHGGETFREATRIDQHVADAIHRCGELAPLHNPVNLNGIRAMQSLYPDTPQIAVFDTAFHQTLPDHAYLYALPRRCYQDWGVRRYGFHGTSHAYILRELAKKLDKPRSNVSLISAHLGNGCSVAAIENGQSRDTSMGLTPLEGLVMGTRSGDVDPGLFDFLQRKGLSQDSISRMLNQESGLLGLSGKTNDMRSLVQAADSGNRAAQEAIDVFCFRLARYIGAMMASLSHLDGLVFTGGIGENSPRVRAKTVRHLRLLGFEVDDAKNENHGQDNNGSINAAGHGIYVIPTDEEGMIAREALEAIDRSSD